MFVYMTMAIRRQGRWIAQQGRCAEPRSRVPYPVQVVRMRQAAEASMGVLGHDHAPVGTYRTHVSAGAQDIRVRGAREMRRTYVFFFYHVVGGGR